MKKKRIFSFFAVIVSMLTVFSGCNFKYNTKQTQFESGDFIYTYSNITGSSRPHSNGKYIVILQLSEAGKEKETIIIPEEIDGKPVVQIGMTGLGYSYSPLDWDFTSGKPPKFTRMYLPSTLLCVYVNEYSLGFTFLINVDKRLLLNDGAARYSSDWIFVSKDDYDKFKCDDVNNLLHLANINYYVDGEVFWIDNSPYLDHIAMEKQRPPEPTKSGYRFIGWFREPELKNKWDFDTDEFPAWEEDEAGNLIITNFYAGWEKI